MPHTIKWDRDSVLLELSKFAVSRKTASPSVSRYRRFYGLHEVEAPLSMGWAEIEGFKIVLQYYQAINSKGTVFLLHGYFDHVGLYAKLVRCLVDNGYSVFTFDLPGHGLSSGVPTSISSFGQYRKILSKLVDQYASKVAQPVHLTGQSTGGAIIIDYLLSNSVKGSVYDPFDKVVLLAPLVRPKGWESITRIHKSVKMIFRKWKRSYTANTQDISFLTFIKDGDPLQSKWLAVDWIGALKLWLPGIEGHSKTSRSLHVIQGTHDLTVDWRHNLSVIRYLFSEVKVSLVDKARHHLVNESLLTRREIFKVLIQELDA